MNSSYDITIVGSGIVGATIALILAKQSQLKIAVIEAKTNSFEWQENSHYDYRVSALSHSSKNIFQHLNIWEKIKSKRISPYTQMHVWDAGGAGEVHFDCQEVGESELGYIIEDNVIRSSLLASYQRYQNIHFLCPFKLMDFQEKNEWIELTSLDDQVLQTKLLIAADGANSWVREKIGIDIKSKDYQHTAIVATVKTQLPHQSTAWQRFLPSGPLAFLPLRNPHLCSIVWSATHDDAAELMTLNDDAFQKRLCDEFANKLGEISSVSPRHFFPLRMRHAKQYVRERIALIGDAAHTVHPLAGQGVNMGLLDAASLAEVIVTAFEKKRDFASLATLRHYERWRKGDTLAMLVMVDALKQLFANEKKSVQCVRNIGLNFTNQIPFFKNFLTCYALGKRGDLPTLAQ